MADKTNRGLFTEADVVIDYHKLSPSAQAYRQSQKVWLAPKLEPVRGFYRALGISYIVAIEGCKFRFYCPQDVYNFSYVRDRCHCGYDHMIHQVDKGLVWGAGGVKVWLEGSFSR